MKRRRKILLISLIIFVSIISILAFIDFFMVLKNNDPIFTFHTIRYGEYGSKYSIGLLYAINNSKGPKIPIGTGEQNLWSKSIVVFPLCYINIIYIKNFDKLNIEGKQKEMIQKILNNYDQ
jgi:hypothetical protein